MKNTNKVVNFKQLGTTGLKRHGPYVYEEFLPELRWPRAGKVYQEMADNDPVIGAILYLAEMLIRGTSWSVEPASTRKEDTEAAEFLESCMNDMEMSWPDTISEILSMLTYGFSFHEVLYKVRRGPNERSPRYRSKYSDGRIGWRNLPVRSQDSLNGWVFNKDNEAVAFEQLAEPNYQKVIIPFSKGLLFRTRVTRDNPEGKSLLRNAYRPWFFKKHFEEIEGIGIERDLAGFPVLQTPEGLDLWNEDDPQMVALRQRAEALVANVRRDSEEGILLPYGWDLKLLTSGSSRQIDIGSTIERYDNRIAITLLSDIILLGSKSGSFALADTKQSMLAASLQAQLLNIADVFNTKAVPRLFQANNFTNYESLPKIVPGQIQTPSLKEVALILRAMGLEINDDMELQNYLRRVMNMPELTEADHKALYSSSATNTNNVGNKETTTDPVDDTSQKDFEQNDMNYIGGEN